MTESPTNLSEQRVRHGEFFTFITPRCSKMLIYMVVFIYSACPNGAQFKISVAVCAA